MLKTLRKRQKLLLAIFISLVSIVFVFWGFYGDSVRRMSRQDIASVNGERISIQEFQSQYQRTIQLYQNILKDKFSPEMAQRFNLKRLSLNQLVDQKLLMQGGKNLGVTISDEEVRDQILEIPYFKKNNQFDPELYRTLLKANRLTPATFEENIRQDLLQRKIVGLISTHLKVTPEEALKDFILKNDKINIEFIKIDPNTLQKSAEIAKEELKAFSENKENITEALHYYTAHSHIYQQEHQVKARHILIKTSEKPTDPEKEKAQTKAKEILEKTKKEDFSKLAEHYSEDVATAKQGGDLGYFGKGRMVKPFEDAAFKLKPGEISNIVETPFGFHIIKAEDILLEKQRTFEEVKESIFQKLISEQKNDLVAKNLVQELWKKHSQKDDFDKALKQEKLSWEETGEFARNTKFVPKIGDASELLHAVFKLQKVGDLADRYYPVKRKFYIVRLKKKEVADLKKFETEKTQLTEKTLNQKQSDAYYQWLKSLKDSAKISIRKDFLGEEDNG